MVYAGHFIQILKYIAFILILFLSNSSFAEDGWSLKFPSFNSQESSKDGANKNKEKSIAYTTSADTRQEPTKQQANNTEALFQDATYKNFKSTQDSHNKGKEIFDPKLLERPR